MSEEEEGGKAYILDDGQIEVVTEDEDPFVSHEVEVVTVEQVAAYPRQPHAPLRYVQVGKKQPTLLRTSRRPSAAPQVLQLEEYVGDGGVTLGPATLPPASAGLRKQNLLVQNSQQQQQPIVIWAPQGEGGGEGQQFILQDENGEMGEYEVQQDGSLPSKLRELLMANESNTIVICSDEMGGEGMEMEIEGLFSPDQLQHQVFVVEEEMGDQSGRRKGKKRPLLPGEAKRKRGQNELRCMEDSCTATCSNVADLRKHLTNAHFAHFEEETLIFDSQEQFKEWRETYERERMVSFIFRGGTKKISHNQAVTYLICHRSGHYKPTVPDETPRKRKLKPQGSCKMNGYCTAGIKLLKNLDSGQVKIDICHTHYGHSLDSQAIAYLRVNPVLRRLILSKFDEGMSFNDVLEYIHHNPDGMEGLRLVDRRAIRNIYDQWKKPGGRKSSTPHPAVFPPTGDLDLEAYEIIEDSSNLPILIVGQEEAGERMADILAQQVKQEALEVGPIDLDEEKKKKRKKKLPVGPDAVSFLSSVEKLMKVAEGGPTVLCFKKAGDDGEEEGLREEDLFLLLQTPVQRQILQMFPQIIAVELLKSKNDALCLLVMMVLDEFREAVPVAWLVSSGVPERITSLFFRTLRDACGDLECGTMFAPRGTDFHRAFSQVFTKQPKYLQNEFEARREVKAEVSRAFPNERERKAVLNWVEGMFAAVGMKELRGLWALLRRRAGDFEGGETFVRHFASEWWSCAHEWALCHRIDSPDDVNTLFAADFFTKLKKFITFKGTGRLSRSVDHILKIGYDKCFLRSKRLFKGDQKQKLITEITRSRHDLALRMETGRVSQGSSWWNVIGDEGEEFRVADVKNPCDCRFRCDDCAICLHSYVCSCPLYRTVVLCEHIHLVHMLLRGERVHEPLPPDHFLSTPMPRPRYEDEDDGDEVEMSVMVESVGNLDDFLPNEETDEFSHQHMAMHMKQEQEDVELTTIAWEVHSDSMSPTRSAYVNDSSTTEMTSEDMHRALKSEKGAASPSAPKAMMKPRVDVEKKRPAVVFRKPMSVASGRALTKDKELTVIEKMRAAVQKKNEMKAAAEEKKLASKAPVPKKTLVPKPVVKKAVVSKTAATTGATTSTTVEEPKTTPPEPVKKMVEIGKKVVEKAGEMTKEVEKAKEAEKTKETEKAKEAEKAKVAEKAKEVVEEKKEEAIKSVAALVVQKRPVGRPPANKPKPAVVPPPHPAEPKDGEKPGEKRGVVATWTGPKKADGEKKGEEEPKKAEEKKETRRGGEKKEVMVEKKGAKKPVEVKGKNNGVKEKDGGNVRLSSRLALKRERGATPPRAETPPALPLISAPTTTTPRPRGRPPKIPKKD